MSYTIKPKSNYEGFRDLDRMLEKIDSGKLRPPRTNAVDHFCPLCHCTKRSQRLVPSRVLGVPVSQLPNECKTAFQGRFVVCCEDCARDLKRSRVA